MDSVWIPSGFLVVDGASVRSNDAIDDFALRNLDFQVLYRYEFAPLSYLYIAYMRGGSLFDAGAGPYSVGDEFRGRVRSALQRAIAGQTVVSLRDLNGRVL